MRRAALQSIEQATEAPTPARLTEWNRLVEPASLTWHYGRGRAKETEVVAVLDTRWRRLSIAGQPSGRVDHDDAVRVAMSLTSHIRRGEGISVGDGGQIVMRLRHRHATPRPVRLEEMAYFAVEAFEQLRPGCGSVNIGIGWAGVTRRRSVIAAERHARAAAEVSLNRRDHEARWHDGTRRQRRVAVATWSTAIQLFVATIGAPLAVFGILVGLHHVGLDLSTPLYWGLVAALAITAGTIWAECLHAVDPPSLPAASDGPAPTATAIIAAYLPNEAETIVETVSVFLSQQYSGRLQVILAYNTPTVLAVEIQLAAIAAADPRLTVLKVPHSTSKAQNVNAALAVAEGEMVAIFDADHHPMQGAFERAWRWLDDGVDVVQGHCVVRNGKDTVVARLVAVEFEQIYAVAHPGRASMHGFGVFGGSNGYWRRETLDRVRLRGSFLTEDIESSMRVLQDGGRIVNDPGLVSRELAPDTLQALWRQRMRWAQGWFQVSTSHLVPLLRSPTLTIRQKAGAAYLMGWREIYPWIALMTWPLLGYLVWRDGGLDLSSPLFLLITLFVTASGPVQTLTAWRLAAPEIRCQRRWFLLALLVNVVVYTEYKNLINRVAHLKQLRGEHQWVVTPRSASSTSSERTGSGDLSGLSDAIDAAA